MMFTFQVTHRLNRSLRYGYKLRILNDISSAARVEIAKRFVSSKASIEVWVFLRCSFLSPRVINGKKSTNCHCTGCSYKISIAIISHLAALHHSCVSNRSLRWRCVGWKQTKKRRVETVLNNLLKKTKRYRREKRISLQFLVFWIGRGVSGKGSASVELHRWLLFIELSAFR